MLKIKLRIQRGKKGKVCEATKQEIGLKKNLMEI